MNWTKCCVCRQVKPECELNARTFNGHRICDACNERMKGNHIDRAIKNKELVDRARG